MSTPDLPTFDDYICAEIRARVEARDQQRTLEMLRDLLTDAQVRDYERRIANLTGQAERLRNAALAALAGRQ